MPIEYRLLKDKPQPLKCCPVCGGKPLYASRRGQVHNWWRRFLRKPYCAVNCWQRNEIVGYEKPE
jgi:hypothetical protein